MKTCHETGNVVDRNALGTGDLSWTSNSAEGTRPGGLSDYASCGGHNGSTGALIPALVLQAVDPGGAPLSTLSSASPPLSRCLSFQSQTNFAAIVDGLSNTLLLGEKYIRPTSFTGKLEDRSVFGSENGDTYRRLAGNNGANPPVLRPLVPTIEDPGPDPNSRQWANTSFGSHHPGVCQFVFCDGSVKALRNTLDVATLELLGRRADGQTIPGF
jgi:prepilin-type processing-associated H-X9-DG protein